MSLLSDCLAAGGTLVIAIGSGLQAWSELKRYGAVAHQLHLTEAGDAAAELIRATMRISSIFILTGRYWHLPTDFKSLIIAMKQYFRAARAIGSTKLTDDEKTEASELYRKSLYWFLIMLGTLVVFASAIVGIVLDVK